MLRFISNSLCGCAAGPLGPIDYPRLVHGNRDNNAFNDGTLPTKSTFIGQITALTLQIMALFSVYHEITGIRVYLTLQRRYHTGNRISIG
jgi:hypothetical protein